jgi:hypothetical protein
MGQDRSNADALYDWFINEVETGWGTGAMAQGNSPIRTNDPRYIAWMACMERLTCSPGTAVATWRATYATDLSQVLPSVAVPTLVIHSLNNLLRDTHLAELIPGARYVEIPGDGNWAGTDDGRAGDEIEEFLTGVRHSRAPERILATVVFTDIVDSTSRGRSQDHEHRWSYRQRRCARESRLTRRAQRLRPELRALRAHRLCKQREHGATERGVRFCCGESGSC